MEQVVVAIYDVKAKVYAQPWFVATEAVAVRSFTDLVNSPERGGTVHTHAEDYQLYVLATYDDSNGSFKAHSNPKHLVTGSSVKKESKIDRGGLSIV